MSMACSTGLRHRFNTFSRRVRSPPARCYHAHRRLRDPRVLKEPVDCEFLLRAAHAGLRFASTGKITAHKFAASHRYLSYLRVSSNEQREFLRKLTRPFGIDVDEIISKSKKNGQYMAMQYVDFSAFQEDICLNKTARTGGSVGPHCSR